VRAFVLLLLLCVACGGTQKKPHAPNAEWLAKIVITGNTAIASDDLIPGLALHRNETAERSVDPYQMSVDTERIRAAYLKLGFFTATVSARIDRVAPNSGAQIVTFTVVEGKRALTRVAITGLPPEVPYAQARAVVKLAEAAPFDYDKYDDAKQPLRALVENAGYAHVDLTATVIADPRNNVAILQYSITSGPLCKFGAVELQDVRPELREAVMARIKFKTGERYSVTALEKTQSELYAIGRFATVRITRDLDKGAEVPVVIAFAEQSRHELKAGGGIGYEPLEWELRVRGGAGLVPEHHPLWHLGVEMRLAITAPHDETTFGANTSELRPLTRLIGTAQRMDLFRPKLTGEIEAGLDYLTVEAYTTSGERLRLGLSSPLGVRWLTARVGWMLEDLQFLEVSSLLFQSDKDHYGIGGSERVGAFQESLSIDLRDNPIAPRNGIYVLLNANEGTKYAGSEYNYLQLNPELRGYVASGDTIFAARVRLGLILGDVPATERYFSGGASSQRGFSERALAPFVRSEDDAGHFYSVPVGGAALLETSLEIRRKLAELGSFPFGVNVFLDGGDVTDTPGKLDALNLHWAAGGGVWLSFGGLKVRLEAGIRLNRIHGTPGENYEPEDGSHWAGHLGVGETF
jgi:translocation and assembly module TamA